MKYKIIETVKISMIMTTILNFFICIATELRYIEFIYLLLFLGINLYMIGVKGYFKIETYNYSLYTIRKKIVDSQRATILSINILIFALNYGIARVNIYCRTLCQIRQYRFAHDSHQHRYIKFIFF